MGVSDAGCEALPLYLGGLTPSGSVEGKRIVLTLDGSYGGGALILNGTIALKHDCVLVKGGAIGREGNYVPIISGEGAHVTIAETTVRAVEGTWYHSLQFRESGGATLTMRKDRVEDCDECVVADAESEIAESYIIANNPWWGNENLHREPLFSNVKPLRVVKSTIFEPEDQTAIIFAGIEEPGSACATKVTFEEDLISGGNASFQVCGHSTLKGAGSYLKIRNNRFASCRARPLVKLKAGFGCKGPEGVDSHTAGDAYGFLAYGGSSGYSTPILGTELARDEVFEFTGNKWDFNGAPVTQAEAER